MQTKYYVITVVGDVEPELSQPFINPEERDAFARYQRSQDDGDLEDGIYWLDIDEVGYPTIGSYSGIFFDDSDA
jgi:hypothetical protein